MKKYIISFLFLAVFLAACSPEETREQNEATNEGEVTTLPAEEQEETATASSGGEYYRTVIPYELSPSRGLTSSNMVSSYNIEAFEKGLFELSRESFSTEEYVFREGQVFTEEMIRGYLGRAYTTEEIEAMSEEEMASNNAFSNLGLNPSVEGETDPELIAEASPLYLSHVLEQNYMVENEGSFDFKGMTIGLAMNSEYQYQKEQYGPMFTRELDEDTIRQEGEQMAQEILERIRANEDYEDITIRFGIFIQSADTAIVPGDFVSTAEVDPGADQIDSFEQVNSAYALLPSSEAGAISEEINNEYINFNRNLESYFDSFTTSVGQGYFVDGTLERLTIEIPLEYSSRGEVIGLTQYVRGLVSEQFNETEVEVSIKDKNKTYALITKTDENDISVHIYE
ncbi:CamS family sex pheromone protein [Salinicoccus hispanicus]|uniref:CamS family sex pheromone protein n=1 Tax=Salinicoccus hispanicus TaxID=157225 RepID=A0A6N8U4A2_9STAP|nr:CamS family sex pheromone protein [Salinicoccus hispanicus]MXQ51936.1 CamS family sex pheromone protein [Salinicoccus hispanicus]